MNTRCTARHASVAWLACAALCGGCQLLPSFSRANVDEEARVQQFQDALTASTQSINAGELDKLFSPVSLGIFAGLVVGKPLGIGLFAWAAVRLKLAELPGDLNFSQLISASFLAGVGFTLSLFIANSAFPDPEVLVSAKLAIILASVVAAAIGTALMLRAKPEAEESSSGDLIAVEEVT